MRNPRTWVEARSWKDPSTDTHQQSPARSQAGEFEPTFGSRIRVARMAVGMSQAELGKHLGVSFQQVQKYEKGKDRFAVGSLVRLAAALKIHPSSFFDDIPWPSEGDFKMKETMRIAETLQRVRNPGTRRQIAALIEAIAEADNEAGAGVTSEKR